MIHKYFLNGFYIVLDVYSGAIHVVDELCYTLLGALGDSCAALPEHCPQGALKAAGQAGYSAEQVQVAYGELYELYATGQLYASDDYDVFTEKMTASPVKAMCLHIAHDCNLRCEYCFAGKGDYHEGRSLMSEEVGRAAVDYLLHHSQGRHNLEIDFFGGEPLLNFEVVKNIVKYARSKEQEHDKLFRFTLTTNGVLLDESKAEFINREMYNVVLSADGRREVHDRVRTRIDGSGCYDTIMPKLTQLISTRTQPGMDQYYVRGTFTKYNKDFAQDVLHLYGQGFDQLSVEPVVAHESADYALTHADLPEIFAEYEGLAKKFLEMESEGEWPNFFHFMLDLEQGPCAIKRLRGCGCGNEYVAVTPDGDVYPCHQFVGQEEFKMGSVFDKSIDGARKAQFAAATVLEKPECRSCWAKFYCSGGCNANNHLYNGDILKPVTLSCEMEKKRIECAVMIKAAQA